MTTKTQLIHATENYWEMFREYFNTDTYEKELPEFFKAGHIGNELVTDIRAGCVSFMTWPETHFEIRYNERLAFCNIDNFIKTTVLHEVCHAVQYWTDGHSDHGEGFQNLMKFAGGEYNKLKLGTAEFKRLYPDYRRQKPLYLYTCDGCGAELQLTQIRHTKQQKSGGMMYQHITDHSLITYQNIRTNAV